MKKLLTFLMFFLLATIAAQAAEKTVTLGNWTTKPIAGANQLVVTGTLTDSNQGQWDVSIKGSDQNKNPSQSVASGTTYWQIGANGNMADAAFMTSSITSTIKKIEVDCAAYQGKGSISVMIGNNSFGEEQTIPTWSNNKGGTVTFSGNASGNIEVRMKATTGGRAIYLSSITVTYEDNTTPSGPTKLSAPTNLASSDVTVNSATLSWDAVTNASSYTVKIGETEYANATSPYSATGLTANTPYTWTVKAIGDGTNYTSSDYATNATFKTLQEQGGNEEETKAATIAAGTNGYDATVNNKSAIKVGTSSKGGSMTITVPAGATSLIFYAAAWNGVSNLDLNITPNAYVTPSSVSLTADTGIAGNSPFTLSGNEDDYKFTITLSNITAETTFTLTSSIEKRFVVWGATYTNSDEPTTKYSVTIAEDITNGTVTADVTKAAEGTTVTLTATPADGYKFDSWNVTNASTSEAIEVTDNKFTMPAADVNVSATFSEIPKYVVTILTPENGTLTVKNGETVINNGDEVAEGTELTIECTPADGYRFKNWGYKDGDANWVGNMTATFTHTMPAAPVSFKATFEAIPTYTITWSVNGQVTTQTVQEGTSVTVPVVNTIGDMVFTGWVTNSTVDSDVTPEYVTPATTATADATYYAVFAKKTEGGTPETKTASVNIETYANNHQWVSNQTYENINIDENIIATAIKGNDVEYNNTGAYIGNTQNGSSWRLYSNEESLLTIEGSNNCKINSVKLTFTNDNKGGELYYYNGNDYDVTISGTTINYTEPTAQAIFQMGTGSGHIRISDIEVNYTISSATYSNFTTLVLPTISVEHHSRFKPSSANLYKNTVTVTNFVTAGEYTLTRKAGNKDNADEVATVTISADGTYTVVYKTTDAASGFRYDTDPANISGNVAAGVKFDDYFAVATLDGGDLAGTYTYAISELDGVTSDAIAIPAGVTYAYLISDYDNNKIGYTLEEIQEDIIAPYKNDETVGLKVPQGAAIYHSNWNDENLRNNTILYLYDGVVTDRTKTFGAYNHDYNEFVEIPDGENSLRYAYAYKVGDNTYGTSQSVVSMATCSWEVAKGLDKQGNEVDWIDWSGPHTGKEYPYNARIVLDLALKQTQTLFKFANGGFRVWRNCPLIGDERVQNTLFFDNVCSATGLTAQTDTNGEAGRFGLTSVSGTTVTIFARAYYTPITSNIPVTANAPAINEDGTATNDNNVYYVADHNSEVRFLNNSPITGIDDITVNNAVKAYKVIENGQVIIVRGDQRFNIMGQPVR